jgi:hypothetical protein
VNVKLVAAGSALVLALGGAGAAAATTGNAGSAAHPARIPGVTPSEAVGTVFDAALAYLQIDRETLAKDLRSGQSLAQIAVAHGKTADGLVDATVAAAQSQLDALVGAGRLDSAREQALLTRFRTALTALVTRTLPARQAGTTRPRPVTMFLQPLLLYLRLHLVTLPNGFRPLPAPMRPVQQRLNNGTSLAQIAIAHARATLDAQVAAGKLTAAQEAALLARLQAATAALVGGGHS